MNLDTEKLSNYDKIEKIAFIVDVLDNLSCEAGDHAVKLACKFYLFS